MLLRLEQRVEIPEWALHVSIRRHFWETHGEENLTELRANLNNLVNELAYRNNRKWNILSGYYQISWKLDNDCLPSDFHLENMQWQELC